MSDKNKITHSPTDTVQLTALAVPNSFGDSRNKKKPVPPKRGFFRRLFDYFLRRKDDTHVPLTTEGDKVTKFGE